MKSTKWPTSPPSVSTSRSKQSISMASKSKCRYGIQQVNKDLRPSLRHTIKEQQESYLSTLLQTRNHFKIWKIGSNKSTSLNLNQCARSSWAIRLIVKRTKDKYLLRKGKVWHRNTGLNLSNAVQKITTISAKSLTRSASQ